MYLLNRIKHVELWTSALMVDILEGLKDETFFLILIKHNDKTVLLNFNKKMPFWKVQALQKQV